MIKMGRSFPLGGLFRLLLNRYLCFFAAFFAADYVLYSKLSQMLLSEDGELEEMKPENYQRITINQLIANVSVPLDLLTKIPTRNESEEERKKEHKAFVYQRVSKGKEQEKMQKKNP